MSTEYLIEPLYGEYCLLSGGRCSHYPVSIIPNSFFIAEPYDAERISRENAIKKALRGYPVTIADENAMNIAITCKICHEIQSTQFGIVDITGLNENVLIELGMLYGFNKPVVILVKDNQKTQIEIPSNVIGIEQVRYKDYPELTTKLENVLKKLFELWRKKGEYIISLIPMLEAYVTQLELAIETKKLIQAKLESRIISFKMIGNQAFAIIDKGEDEGIKRKMFLKVFRCDQKVGEEYLEEEVGLVLVSYTQKKISHTIPIPYDPRNDFWKNAFNRTTHPRNIARFYLPDHYEKLSEEDLKETASVLKRMLKHIYVGMMTKYGRTA